MTTPANEWREESEKAVRDFCNQIAMQLNASNDTMQAVRLFRKEIPNLLDTDRARIVERISELKKNERNMKKGDVTLETYDEVMVWNQALDQAIDIVKDI